MAWKIHIQAIPNKNQDYPLKPNTIISKLIDIVPGMVKYPMYCMDFGVAYNPFVERAMAGTHQYSNIYAVSLKNCRMEISFIAEESFTPTLKVILQLK